jgi:hypothetical protein
MALATAGCSNLVNPYSVGYKISPDGESPCLKVSISGPAAELAVILTDQTGKSHVDIIQKEALITGHLETSVYPRFDSGDRFFHAGAYSLAVKTVDPEKVVWQTKLIFSPTCLKVEDVKVTFGLYNGIDSNQYPPGTVPAEVLLFIRKTGNLPIEGVRGCSISVDGDEYSTEYGEGGVKTDVKGVTGDGLEVYRFERLVRRYYGSPRFLKSGRKCLVKGSVACDGDNRLEFEKEIVVP